MAMLFFFTSSSSSPVPLPFIELVPSYPISNPTEMFAGHPVKICFIDVEPWTSQPFKVLQCCGFHRLLSFVKEYFHWATLIVGQLKYSFRTTGCLVNTEHGACVNFFLLFSGTEQNHGLAVLASFPVKNNQAFLRQPITNVSRRILIILKKDFFGREIFTRECSHGP